VAKSRKVAEDWDHLLDTRLGSCTACWDHISTTPTVPVGKRYEPLKGALSHCDYEGQRLRQWQWEIDKGARVKVGVGKDFVVIMSVSSGHPKESE
jgi:hypothetical protein